MYADIIIIVKFVIFGRLFHPTKMVEKRGIDPFGPSAVEFDFDLCQFSTFHPALAR